jgi:hypothetical protein
MEDKYEYVSLVQKEKRRARKRHGVAANPGINALRQMPAKLQTVRP